jgi:hypothetical protein
MRYILAAILVTFGVHAGNAHGTSEGVANNDTLASQSSYDFPAGTVITVTDDGVTIQTAPDEVDSSGSDNSGADNSGSDTPVAGDPVVYVDESEYCYGADYAEVDCDASRNYDPWIASTGERAYWLRNQLTLSIPFTLPSRNDSDAQADIVQYGYFQMTAQERKRDKHTEDIFHVWFSEEPNGSPLGGKCEKWMLQARGYLYWSQDEALAPQVCFLGHEPRVLYANFETACYAPSYEGSCSDTIKQKSSKSYQFDVARYVKGY